MFFVHIMKACPGTLLTLHGRDSANGGEEPLHIRIFGKIDDNLTRAKTMADDLVSSVRKQYRTWKMIQMKQQARAMGGPKPADLPQTRALSEEFAAAPWQALASEAPAAAQPAAPAAAPPAGNPSSSAAEEEYDPLAAGSDSDDD
mmetsp:Transcript_5967/g.10838  ORF Transcript_5967/g.10838 Transcript_5967/m.10838 type:complete len:145 (+) Transcript_5967:191-625(+)